MPSHRHPARRAARRPAGAAAAIASAVAALGLLAAGCASVTTSGEVAVDGRERWALLPIENLSATPRAGDLAQDLVETRLRARGLERLDAWVDDEPTSIRDLVDADARLARAERWARAEGYRYALTGTVHEWRYRSGIEREPVVGLGLKLVELDTGRVLWQASAARTGWGASNLSKVGARVVRELLDGVRLDGPGADDGLVAAAKTR